MRLVPRSKCCRRRCGDTHAGGCSNVNAVRHKIKGWNRVRLADCFDALAIGPLRISVLGAHVGVVWIRLMLGTRYYSLIVGRWHRPKAVVTVDAVFWYLGPVRIAFTRPRWMKS